MENTMMNSQSAAAVNSAVSKIFSNKSVLDLAVLAYKRMAKSPNGCSDKISVVVGDGYRVTMDCGMDENDCYLVLNIYLEEKNGNRYVRMREYHSGWADMGTEYMACGSWKSVVVYAIKDAIESMVSKILDNYIKDGDKYSIALWEDMTGMVYMAPELDEAPELEEDYTIEEVCDGFYEIVFNDGEDNDITEDGYSVAGLKYLAENMPVVPVDAIVEGVNEYFSDCYAVARNRCMGFYECDFEEFCDIVWSYVWPNVMTDEALEAETRYYMEFNDRLRYMLDNGELGALYIYNNDFVRSRFDEEAEVAA